MTKKILVSTNKLKKIRVAFIENQKLYNLEVESENNKKKEETSIKEL